MRFSATYFRNFIFGVEDSLVSTVGLLSGIAIAGEPRETILLTGIVLIFVEAFSMAAGSFLSEASAEEYVRHRAAGEERSLGAALTMFLSYFIAGFVPLAPYLFFPRERALSLSVACSIAALFFLGLTSGRMTGVRMWRSALRMAIVGSVAIAVAASVGSFLGS